MGDTDTLESELIAAEKAVWWALATGDAAADEASLADGFLGVYPDGFAGKSDHVGQLAEGATVVRFELNDYHVVPLGVDHAALSYRSRFCRTAGEADEVVYVTSIWRRNAKGWINIFSQDTPALNDQ